MRNYNFLSIILLGITLVAVQTQKKIKYYFPLIIQNSRNYTKESLSLSILNSNSKTIDSIIYYVNDKKVGSKKGVEKLSLNLKIKTRLSKPQSYSLL
jgi:hypothetical protein